MVQEVAPNLSYHYWFLGIRGLSLQTEASPKILVRGSEFNHERNIEEETDEGHMGTATTKMSTYRTKASADPSFSDKCRYKEGWEDMWLLLLGSAKGGSGSDKNDIVKEETSSGSGIYNYTFKINVDAPQDPYFCSLLNGFAKTENDAYKYEDCLMSQFELTGSNENAPTYTSTFSSNYPKVNQANVARTIPSTTIFPKASDVKIYIAPVLPSNQTYVEGTAGTGEVSIDSYAYPCYLDWSLSVNNNIESVPCSGDDFGESTKVLGTREGTVSVTIPWTSSTKFLEKEFETGSTSTSAHDVSSENQTKTIWIVMENGTIGSSQLKYKTIIKIPQVTVTSCYSEQSGTDAKQIQLEANIDETGSQSFIETVITTDLEDLHIDNGS